MNGERGGDLGLYVDDERYGTREDIELREVIDLGLDVDGLAADYVGDEHDAVADQPDAPMFSKHS